MSFGPNNYVGKYKGRNVYGEALSSAFLRSEIEHNKLESCDLRQAVLDRGKYWMFGLAVIDTDGKQVGFFSGGNKISYERDTCAILISPWQIVRARKPISSKCAICEAEPTLWLVGRNGFCRKHREQAYAARAQGNNFLDAQTGARNAFFKPIIAKKEKSLKRKDYDSHSNRNNKSQF